MTPNRLHRVTVIRTVRLQAEALIEAVDADDAKGQIEHQLEMASQGGIVPPSLAAIEWGEVADGVFEDPMLGDYEIVSAEAERTDVDAFEFCDHCADEVTPDTRCIVESLTVPVASADEGESATLCPKCFASVSAGVTPPEECD